MSSPLKNYDDISLNFKFKFEIVILCVLFSNSKVDNNFLKVILTYSIYKWRFSYQKCSYSTHYTLLSAIYKTKLEALLPFCNSKCFSTKSYPIRLTETTLITQLFTRILEIQRSSKMWSWRKVKSEWISISIFSFVNSK